MKQFESKLKNLSCCKIGCRKRAEVQIEYGYTADDFTQSCLNHIGDLLTDANEHRIYYQGTDKLIEYLKSIWWTPEMGIKEKGNILELHTLGWSGNELIMNKLVQTMFWKLYWEKSVRGGHYYFKICGIKKSKKSKELK